ncbi:uncharacterized protein B0H18DRAFT_160127 [Fomitopsis serialis]|uniref:uncharacterized protein n=1 Tax=Fomitopsis serialis TaxID=139415 RepID=UPI002008512E|nr:uncharacterized protein B0H18DRAFT_160127 [Neoantrodia serialis]KAH9930049.1 hypothetical protein B0H18DRAFT_160127 [Neoantrodia serialis]
MRRIRLLVIVRTRKCKSPVRDLFRRLTRNCACPQKGGGIMTTSMRSPTRSGVAEPFLFRMAITISHGTNFLMLAVGPHAEYGQPPPPGASARSRHSIHNHYRPPAAPLHPKAMRIAMVKIIAPSMGRMLLVSYRAANNSSITRISWALTNSLKTRVSTMSDRLTTRMTRSRLRVRNKWLQGQPVPLGVIGLYLRTLVDSFVVRSRTIERLCRLCRLQRPRRSCPTRGVTRVAPLARSGASRAATAEAAETGAPGTCLMSQALQDNRTELRAHRWVQ